jgi:predicted nucleic acid-binding protein
MKYVLDTNVALKWVLPEPDSAKANNLRSEFQHGLHELLAPDVFPVECAHALTRAERQKIVQPGEAAKLLFAILGAGPTLHPYQPLLPRAVELSSQLHIGVYDCLYLALTEQEQCEMVTADAHLATAARGFQVVLLANVP